MKYYQVLYTREHTSLTKENISLREEKYYVVDGKICFSVDVVKRTTKAIVISGSTDKIKEVYGNDCKIEFLKEEENIWDKIITPDYIKLESSSKLSEVKEGTRDEPCSDEVQEDYKKDPNAWFNEPVYISDTLHFSYGI